MTGRIVGKLAPEFEMEAVTPNGQFDTVRLADYRGTWLVLFFYPLDFTFICPTEIVALSASYEDFKSVGAEVLGVSTDSKYSHRAWINMPRHEGGLGPLNYPLASDQLHKVSRDYGVYLEDEGKALRGLFIIDPGGVVRYQVVHELNVGRSVDEVLRVLQALQNGGLCPVNWRAGQQTLVEEVEKPAVAA
jgi:peroxiredoxin 2/4